MYSQKPEPCAIVRTAASVVTSVCLVLITVSMGVAGVYTIRTVNTINTDEIHNIVTKLSSTVDSMHSASNMLTSSHGTILQKIPEIVSEIQPLIQKTPQISSQALQMSNNFKEIVAELKPMVDKIPVGDITEWMGDVVPTIQSLPEISTQLHSSSTDAYKTILNVRNILHSPLALFLQNSTSDLHDMMKVFTHKIDELPLDKMMQFLENHENIIDDLSWVERLSSGLQDLSTSLNQVKFDLFLEEVKKWRNMSKQIYTIVHKISNLL